MASNVDDMVRKYRLTWSDSEYELAEFLETFPLPQIVEVAEGTYGDSDECTLPAGQILTLHVVKRTHMYRGYTYDGDEVFVPINCPQKVEIRPQDVSMVYDTVQDLCTVFPGRVKYVRVTKDHTAGPWRSVQAGQKLMLDYLTEDEQGKPCLMCLDSGGCEVSLSMDVQGGFEPLADNNEYFLAEVGEIFQLPVYVQFISPPKFGNVTAKSATKADSKLLTGLIQIDELMSEDTVIASSREGGRKTILSFPRTLDVSLIACEQALAKDATYARVCETLNDGVDLVRVQRVTDEVVYSTRQQMVREISFTQSLCGLPESSGVDRTRNLDVSGGFGSTDTGVDVVDNILKDDDDDDDDGHEYVEIDKVDDDDDCCYEDMDKVAKSYVSSKAASGIRRKEIEAPSKSGGLTKKMSFAKKFVMPWTKRKKSQEIEDTSSSSPGKADHIYSSTGREMDEDGYTYPLLRRQAPGTVAGVGNIRDEEVQKRVTYVQPVQASQQETGNDISGLTVDEVGDLLRSLNMGEYAERFRKEQVDGSILQSIDKSILQKHFNMTPFHALKLTKATAENWRPNRQ